MTNLSSVKFCDTVDDAETISITLENGNEWTVQLEGGKFKRNEGCFIYLNEVNVIYPKRLEHFQSYKNNAEELAEEEQAISAAEDFYTKWSIKDKAYTEASQALRDGGIAITKILDLYKGGELPFIDFLEFMDAMKSTIQAKTIQGIKHEK